MFAVVWHRCSPSAAHPGMAQSSVSVSSSSTCLGVYRTSARCLCGPAGSVSNVPVRRSAGSGMRIAPDDRRYVEHCGSRPRLPTASRAQNSHEGDPTVILWLIGLGVWVVVGGGCWIRLLRKSLRPQSQRCDPPLTIRPATGPPRLCVAVLTSSSAPLVPGEPVCF